jgi:O-antigen/teichoic acid export membrane protein
MSFSIKEFSYQSFFYTLGDILNKASKFLLIPFYTRIFSQVEYGIIEQVVIITAITDIFISFACKTTLLKLFYDFKNHNKEKSIVGIVFSLILIIALFFLGLSKLLHIFNFTTFAGKNYYPFMFYIVGYSFFLNLANLSLVLMRIYKRVVLYSISNLFITLLDLLFIIVFVKFLHFGVIGKFQGSFWALLSFATVISYFFLRHNISFKFSFSDVKMTIRFAFPLVMNNLLGWLLVSYNKILINIHFGLQDLALFTLGSQLVSAFKLIMDGFLKAYNVLIYEKFDYLKNYFKDFFFVFASIFCFIGSILVLFSKEIISIIATTNYSDSYFVVSLLVFSRVLMLLSSIVLFPLYYQNENTFVFKATFLGAVITVITGYFLIPKYHFLGASISMTIVYSVILGLLLWKLYKYINNLLIWQNLIVLIGFVCVILLSFFPLNIFVRIILLVAYTGVLLFLNKNSMKIIQRKWK